MGRRGRRQRSHHLPLEASRKNTCRRRRCDHEDPARAATSAADSASSLVDSDVCSHLFLQTGRNWRRRCRESFGANATPAPEVRAKAEELTPQRAFSSIQDKLRGVSTIGGLPQKAHHRGFAARRDRIPTAVTGGDSGFRRQCDVAEKCSFAVRVLARSLNLDNRLSLVVPSARSQRGPSTPSILTSAFSWLLADRRRLSGSDPSVEVAPFGMIASSLRGKPALSLSPPNDARFYLRPFRRACSLRGLRRRLRLTLRLRADGTL